MSSIAKLIYVIAFCINFVCHANPFIIDFPDKLYINHDDLLEIQHKLHQIDIDHIVKESGITDPTRCQVLLKQRLQVGLRATLIDPEKGHFPKIILKKIGQGGLDCVVSYATFNRSYPELAESIPAALEKLNFNGYFYCRIGGYPTPTGHETKYIGVPYAFKIFMLQEALLYGFQSVLWIDSSFLPLKNPKPIFDHINKYGAFFYNGVNLSALDCYLFPIVHESLYQLYQKTTVDANIIWGVYGFNKNDPKTKKYFDEYFKAVEMGYPFLSLIPEMPVISIIMSKLNYHPKVLSSCNYEFKKISAGYTERNEEYYFWYREH